MSVLPTPSKEIILHINKMIFGFPDKIKRDILKLPKYLGGISVTDVFLKDSALKIAWVQRRLKTSCSWTVRITRVLELFHLVWKRFGNATCHKVM